MMCAGGDRTIYRGCALCVLLTLMAFVLPRFLPVGEGFAAGAGAALVFFMGLLLATLCALVLLVITVRRHAALSQYARLCGYAPALVLCSGLLGLLWFLAY
jgi:hypothetical protein